MSITYGDIAKYVTLTFVPENFYTLFVQKQLKDDKIL